jgi:hypothetical protein
MALELSLMAADVQAFKEAEPKGDLVGRLMQGRH